MPWTCGLTFGTPCYQLVWITISKTCINVIGAFCYIEMCLMNFSRDAVVVVITKFTQLLPRPCLPVQIPIVIGCLPMQNGMHKSSEHFCLGSKLMPKLHHTNWLADIVYVLWLWSTSCVIRPKVCIMHHIGLSLSWLLLKIYLHTHFLWKICDLIWDSTLKDLIFEEKWWF